MHPNIDLLITSLLQDNKSFAFLSVYRVTKRNDQHDLFRAGSAFSIGNETGKIVTTRPLDRENASRYLLTVQVHVSFGSFHLSFWYRSLVDFWKEQFRTTGTIKYKLS